jgi:hypothetical protein
MPHRVVKTKVFLGKEKWDDFLLLQKVARGTNSLMQTRMLSGPDMPVDSIESRLAKLEESVAMLMAHLGK